MSKLITVFGATGNQGGSVIKHILSAPSLSKSFKIRGITRDPTKPAATKLAQQGVEVVTADLDSKASLTAAIKGSHTVFLVTNYWESVDPAKEISQGKNVADVAKELGVSHLIFSSLFPVKELTNGRLSHVPHFDGKAEIERYIRDSGVPSTFYIPGYFMSNFQQMLQKGEDGSYTLAYPIGKDAKLPLVDAAEDTGKFVKAIIKNRDSLLGAQVLGAAAYYTPEEIVKELESVTGKKSQFFQIDNEQYKSYLPKEIADEMLENHLFIENPGYYNGQSLESSLKILEDQPVSLKEFIAKNDF